MPVKTVRVRDGDELAPGWHSWADATSGAIALTLPRGVSSRSIIVQKIDGSTNPVTVTGLVRGIPTTLTLSGPYDLIELEPDEQGWWWLLGGHRSATSLANDFVRKAAAGDAVGAVPTKQADGTTSYALPASAAAANPFGFPYTVDPGIVRAGDALSIQTASQAVFERVLGAGTISKIGLHVAASAGNISLAVYSSDGAGRAAVPKIRRATTGAVPCPAVGYQEIALDSAVAVSPGDWLALTADSTTATFRALLAQGGDSGLGAGRQYRQAAAHPAPATPAGLIATMGYTFVLVGVT